MTAVPQLSDAADWLQQGCGQGGERHRQHRRGRQPDPQPPGQALDIQPPGQALEGEYRGQDEVFLPIFLLRNQQ